MFEILEMIELVKSENPKNTEKPGKHTKQKHKNTKKQWKNAKNTKKHDFYFLLATISDRRKNE